MTEIKLDKRYKFAGDVHKALVDKCEFPAEVAADFLNSIQDADVVERESVRKTMEQIVERLQKNSDQWLEVYDNQWKKGLQDFYSSGCVDSFDRAIEIVMGVGESYV